MQIYLQVFSLKKMIIQAISELLYCIQEYYYQSFCQIKKLPLREV